MARQSDSAWLKDLFAFENCEECGCDESRHTVVRVLGDRYALCSTFTPQTIYSEEV